MIIYTCTKFRENMSKGLGVIDRTDGRTDRQTDERTDRQTSMGKTICLPQMREDIKKFALSLFSKHCHYNGK